MSFLHNKLSNKFHCHTNIIRETCYENPYILINCVTNQNCGRWFLSSMSPLEHVREISVRVRGQLRTIHLSDVSDATISRDGHVTRPGGKVPQTGRNRLLRLLPPARTDPYRAPYINGWTSRPRILCTSWSCANRSRSPAEERVVGRVCGDRYGGSAGV